MTRHLVLRAEVNHRIKSYWPHNLLMSRYHRVHFLVATRTLEPWEMGGNSPEYAAMSIDELDRAAFGFSREDIKTLHPSQLHIKWKDDWGNAIAEQNKSGLSEEEWAKRIDLSEPIEVVFENGQFYVDDGHHRFYAAKILNKELNVTVEIKDKPHRAIVEKALREGKPVPPNVLRDYPDLAASIA